jgi:hypothetical protein
MRWVNDGFTDNASLWNQIVREYCFGTSRNGELWDTGSDKDPKVDNIPDDPVAVPVAAAWDRDQSRRSND